MRIQSAAIVTAMFVLVTHRLQADDAVGQIAPYMGETSVVTLRVDVKQATAAGIVSLVTGAEPAGAADLFTSDIDSFLSRLRDSRASHIYAIYSLGDIGREAPYLIVPTADAGAAQRLAAALLNNGKAVTPAAGPHNASTADYFDVTEAIGPVVFCGSSAARRRIEGEAVADRPGLGGALEAVRAAPVAILLAPTADQRRVVTEMLPRLPDQFGLDGAVIGDIEWATGVNTDDGRLQIDIQTDNPRSTTSIVTALTTTFPGIAASSDGAHGTLTSPQVDGQPSASMRSVVQMLGGLSNAYDGMQNLQQIALAMHNFHDVYGSFPPTASYDGDRPLLSWRVHLLQYLDSSGLYSQFHLNEPWDSEHNRTLIEKMPDVFKSHDVALNLQGKTVFVLPVNDQTAWHGQVGTTIKEITDGTSNTIMALQTTPDHAVIWTKPDDLAVDLQNAGAGIVGPGEQFMCVFCDGAGHRLPNSIPLPMLKALLTPAGGEVIDWNQAK